jgi:hypothetical protein
MSNHKTMGNLGVVDSFDDDHDDVPLDGDSGGGVKRYYGKYRGTVLPMYDVDTRGRLLVSVSDPHGPNFSGWARPCVPWAGPSMGCYVVPPPLSNVWVEFEHGNPDLPIWVGCWWGDPVTSPLVAKQSVPLSPIFALETIAKHAIIISDTPVPPLLPLGGILLRSGVSYIAIDPKGIRMSGMPGGVSINSDPTGNPATAGLFIL